MIKKIDKNNVAQIYEIEKENFKDSEQYKNIEFLLDNKNYLIVGNFIKDKLISYIIGIDLNEEYELLKIATREEYKNKKFATNLFNHIAKQYKKIFLEVNKNNSIAIKFYKSLGFSKIGERKNYYGNNEDAINLVFEHH
uniref:Ribosomal-protein-alanine N-acetyltransferase RimI n=1 Tax=uncultured Mycoplasmataceae bacterium TaxID=300027 RepID=A0A6G9HI50_9MOLU|nr:ribosomal-protein-alanine N-acetyltransferase RimI [uncultured Mycoplasmataceae bacterium]